MIIDCQESIDNLSNYLLHQPGYLQACERHGDQPARDHDLPALRLIGAAVPLMSVSGGTDIVSALAIGAPTAPVWPGEIAGESPFQEMPRCDLGLE
jgi:acetoacetyl-CoA synthetase